MAKLGYYFSLCPIIDQNSLLGIQEDSKSENVIVTLGKNIAIKYKIADQKQLISWRTKEKFTSPIVYDNDEQLYYAIMNHISLKFWSDGVEQLDKLKKHKFNKQMYTLVTCASKIFVIFINGAIHLLKEALTNRKDLNPINIIDTDNEEICNALTFSFGNAIYIGIIVRTQKGSYYFTWTIFSEEGISTFNRINLEKPDLELYTYTLTEYNNEVHLFTIWSDGKIWCSNLNKVGCSDVCIDCINTISSDDHISMTSLNKNYIALYGADCNQEGANLIIYNILFKKVQCHQQLKMFTPGVKLWFAQNNLFLCVGQNLAVIPITFSAEVVRALLGSHETVIQDPDISIVKNVGSFDWKNKSVDRKKISRRKQVKISPKIANDTKELTTLGSSEETITQEVISKYMENNDIKSIELAINYFYVIPEAITVRLLDFILNAAPESFAKEKEFNDNLPIQLFPMERCHLIDKLLQLEYSETIMTQCIKTYFNFSNSILLLRYICYLLSEDGHTISDNVINSEEVLINWSCILLDTNYQNLILSKDEKNIEILTYFNNLIKTYMYSKEDLESVHAILTEIQRNKTYIPNKNKANLQYSIETLKL